MRRSYDIIVNTRERALLDLSDLLGRMATGERVLADEWPGGLDVDPVALGLGVSEGLLSHVRPPDLLDATALGSALPDLNIEIFHVIDSTNTHMLRATEVGADGRLLMAEFQAGGRGRRGRSWISPYARNLAMTLGWNCRRPLTDLGGLSLVIGLGLAAGLDSLGVEGVELKWPNDVWVDGQKLSGILVELTQQGANTDVIIGMGVNVQLTAEEVALIGQPVTDLRSHGVAASRTQIAIALIRSVRQGLALFGEAGFAPFLAAFNDLHHYHGKACTVSSGNVNVSGTVQGVGMDGALILATSDGEQRFHGGEVSLRPPSPVPEE